MNRNEILKTIHEIGKEQDPPAKLADFILANFTPKGEAEKVTAARIYEAMIAGCFASHANPNAPSPLYGIKDYDLIVRRAHEAAKAFNEYKPE